MASCQHELGSWQAGAPRAHKTCCAVRAACGVDQRARCHPVPQCYVLHDRISHSTFLSRSTQVTSRSARYPAHDLDGMATTEVGSWHERSWAAKPGPLMTPAALASSLLQRHDAKRHLPAAPLLMHAACIVPNPTVALDPLTPPHAAQDAGTVGEYKPSFASQLTLNAPTGAACARYRHACRRRSPAHHKLCSAAWPHLHVRPHLCMGATSHPEVPCGAKKQRWLLWAAQLRRVQT